LPGYHWIRQRFDSEEGHRQIAKSEELQAVAQDLGVSLAQLAIAWCVKCPFVSTVITGASNPLQVKENMDALETVSKLNDEVMTQIEEILDNKPAPEPNFR